VENIHTPAISCYYSEEEKGALLTPQAHYEYQMILVIGGKSTFFVNHQKYELEEKSLIFISRMERHSFVIQETPYRRYVVSLSGELLMSDIKNTELISILLHRPKDFCHVIRLKEETFQRILPFFQGMAEECGEQAAFHITKCTAFLLALLIDVYRSCSEYFSVNSQTNVSEMVLNAQRYVNNHYNRQLTLQEIADESFVSRHTLSLAFKDMIGMTFKDYLVLFRITEAKKLLRFTDLSVVEIALNVGYQNVNNFIRIFKAKENITPLQYRKESGGEEKTGGCK